jgi:hypothetical protein
MSTTKKRSLSGSRIDLSSPGDINYWTKRWEISPHQLLAAIINTQSTSIRLIAGYLKQYGFYNLPTDYRA